MSFLHEIFQNRSGGPWVEGYTAGMCNPNEWIHRNVTQEDKSKSNKRVWIVRPIYVNGRLFHRISTSRTGWYVDSYGVIEFIEFKDITSALIVPKLEV